MATPTQPVGLENITRELTLEVLKDIVNDVGPDATYASITGDDSGSCTYTDEGGAPRCIVGQFFARVNPVVLKQIHDDEWAKSPDFQPSSKTFTVGTDEGVISRIVEALPLDAARTLRTAQSRQDHGATWREAVDEASGNVLRWVYA